MKKEIQSWMESMGAGACLALDYIFSTLKGSSMSDYESKCYLLSRLLGLCEEGIVEEDGYVTDAKKLLEEVDRDNTYSVTKKDIESIKDIRDEEMVCVRFDYNGHSHWVFVSKGVIVFDSLDDSQCRKYGKPTSARIIKATPKEEKKD